MNEKVKQRIKLFKEGLSIQEISEITGDNYKTVEGTARYYRESGLTVNKKQTNFSDHYYFDEINTEKKAYLLGFFLADGCIDGSKTKGGLYCNRLTINNSVDDLEIIKEFHSEICSKSKVCFKNYQKGVIFRKEQCSIRWSSEHMTTSLINKYNFCRRKAYNQDFEFPFETIPENLHRHFIRGFFDGDGSVDFKLMLTKNGVETSRFQYGFLCNSFKFAKQISDIICNLSEGVTGTITEITGKTTKWYVLRFNTYKINSVEKRYKFYEWLYKDSNIYLCRKKSKFDSFFEYRGKQIV